MLPPRSGTLGQVKSLKFYKHPCSSFWHLRFLRWQRGSFCFVLYFFLLKLSKLQFLALEAAFLVWQVRLWGLVGRLGGKGGWIYLGQLGASVTPLIRTDLGEWD